MSMILIIHFYFKTITEITQMMCYFLVKIQKKREKLNIINKILTNGLSFTYFETILRFNKFQSFTLSIHKILNNHDISI